MGFFKFVELSLIIKECSPKIENLRTFFVGRKVGEHFWVCVFCVHVFFRGEGGGD